MKIDQRKQFYWKKKLTVSLAYSGLIFTFALNQDWQHCNYSKINKAILLKFSGNV